MSAGDDSHCCRWCSQTAEARADPVTGVFESLRLSVLPSWSLKVILPLDDEY